MSEISECLFRQRGSRVLQRDMYSYPITIIPILMTAYWKWTCQHRQLQERGQAFCAFVLPLCVLPLTKQAHAPLHHTTQATGTEILGRHLAGIANGALDKRQEAPIQQLLKHPYNKHPYNNQH